MKLLLDTHVLLWWLAQSKRLPRAARDAIADADLVYISAVTAWEIAIKVSLGKLGFRGDVEEQLALNQFLALPVTVGHAVAAGKLPPHHGDPFDRMLVAQASAESLTLVTGDVRIRRYGDCVMLV